MAIEDPKSRFLVPPSSLSKNEFIRQYGCVYEHSPHFAAEIFPLAAGGSLDTLGALFTAFRNTIGSSDRNARVALIRAHPDLADRIKVGDLTTASKSEQTGAGLTDCSPLQYEEFRYLNDLYKKRFAFPFVKAVRGFSRDEILDEFRRRLANETDQEFVTALEEVHAIAWLRLTKMVKH